MEKVRKGIIAKGKCPQWPQWKDDMKAHGVPAWYIWSCEKIKYMDEYQIDFIEEN